MTKLIAQICMITVLVLGCAGVFLSLKLAGQRETLKVRNQKLENAIVETATSIATDEPGQMLAISVKQLRDFNATHGGKPVIDMALKQVVDGVQGQLGLLNNTRTELTDVKNTIADIEDELETAQADLVKSNNTIKEKEEQLVQKDAVISEKEDAIQTALEEKKQAMEEAVAKVQAIQTQVEELAADKQKLAAEANKMQKRIYDLEILASPAIAEKRMPKGNMGVIASVNPEYNFVVFGIPPKLEDNIVVDLEFLIHRNDKLIGKVRVTKIVNNYAIAEIIGDAKVFPKKGDSVLY